jgi:hypothetical protein
MRKKIALVAFGRMIQKRRDGADAAVVAAGRAKK